MNPLKLLASWSLLVVAFLTLSTTSATAQSPSGTAVVTDTVDGSQFDYTILLNNTSPTATIGTFWFAWVPGQSYLDNAPTSVTNPTGWSDLVVTPGGPDAGGYSIMWSTGSPLAAGGTETFKFTSPETPTELAGNSPFFSNPTIPEATSFLYSGAAFSTPSTQFLANVVVAPEPNYSFMLALGLGVLAIWRSRLYRRLGNTEAR
jgi:hypothetical protein